MAEYIERAKAIEFVNQNICHFNGETTLSCVELCLKAVPAADVVEVVRCRDCKSCDQFYPNKKIGKEPELEFFCKTGKHRTTANDFCSCGERKSKSTLPESTRQTVLDSFMKGSED